MIDNKNIVQYVNYLYFLKNSKPAPDALLEKWRRLSVQQIEDNLANWYINSYGISLQEGKVLEKRFVDFINSIVVDNFSRAVVLEDQSSYIGPLELGVPHGFGTCTWQDGTKYIGDFKLGEFDGYGILYIDESTTYIGAFKNDNFEGIGAYISTEYLSIGEWFEDKRNGQTVVKWKDGDTYLGCYENDFRNGYGILKRYNGERLVGNWKDGFLK